MNAITKTSKKERILFNNPKATQLYREAITELIAFKPWEVNATENMLTICNTYRYVVNKRCCLGYEFWCYDRSEKEWVRVKPSSGRHNPIYRINYFSYGHYTSFGEIFVKVATDFLHVKRIEKGFNFTSKELTLVEILYMSYIRGLYKNHSYSNYVIVEWFKRTSGIDFTHIVKTGFKVGYYTARHLQTLKIVDFLAKRSLDCAAAERYIINNPDFTALYVYLDPLDREKRITAELLNDGVFLNIDGCMNYLFKIPRKSFNRFKNIGTSITAHFFGIIRTDLEYGRENAMMYGKANGTYDEHVNRFREHQSVEILLYLSGLHLELGVKKPNSRFINRLLNRTLRHVLRGNNWQLCKHNIKTIYHAFYKHMYINKDTKARNAYIGKQSESNQLSSDIDIIFDYMQQVRAHQFDKRSSIQGMKIRIQHWIDEKNRLQIENKKNKLIDRNWPARVLPEPVEHNGYRFTEILNFYDLYIEGSKMSHCVYHNFKHSAEEGSVIVFHVQQDNDLDEQATLGLEMVDQKYVVFQSYGYRNKVPSDGLKKATRAFLKEINQNQVR